MAKKKPADKTAEIEDALLAKPDIPPEDMLSTGSTLLNMALTGTPNGGFSKGGYFLLIGDSSSGKTFLTLTCFAEAMRNPSFSDYRLIFDDVEGGALMDIRRYFGEAVAERIEPPSESGNSDTIEDFYFNLADALDDGRPFIYLLDSIDALTSKASDKKFEEKRKASKKGRETTGDYGDGKAKENSQNIRRVARRLRDSGCILIVINQTRDNPAAGMFESKKTHAGGKALNFYARATMWSSVGKSLKKTVRGKDRKIGITCRIRVTKNRFTGKDRVVEVPIYYSYGFDDIGSCVDYLISEDHWKNKGQKVVTEEFGEMTRAALIQKIEDESLEDELRLIVERVHNEIEVETQMTRKPRF